VLKKPKLNTFATQQQTFAEAK